MADETTIQVLHEENKRAESISYMWLFRTGEDGDEPIILYKYSPTRAGETAKANGLNMYHYLCYLLEELPKTDLSEESLTNYLPWNQEVKQDLEEWAKKLLEN